MTSIYPYLNPYCLLSLKSNLNPVLISRILSIGCGHPCIQRGSAAPHPAAGVTRLGAARNRFSVVVDDGQRVAQRARAPSSRVGARATAADERSHGKSLFLQLMHATENYFTRNLGSTQQTTCTMSCLLSHLVGLYNFLICAHKKRILWVAWQQQLIQWLWSCLVR
jgi:hypothetical protein